MAWFDNAWAYRRAVTIDNSSNAANLTNYTVSIALTALNWDFAHAEADGSDIRVTDSGEVNLIPYYIEAYDNVGETGTIWVRVPYVAGSGSATIYIYYGNASPAAFSVPPTGIFTRPAASKGGGLAENMVYDADTNKYYVVTTHTPGTGPIHLWECATVNGVYTDDGTVVDIGGVGTWDHYRVMAPHLFQAPDGTWVIYYTGCPDSTTDGECIGYATAADVTGPYTKSGSNPVLSNSGAATFDRYRAAEPYVFRDASNNWYLFYMGDSGSGSVVDTEAVGYATSDATDGGWAGPWTKYGSNPVIPRGAAGSIDAQIVADPWVYGPLNGHYYVGYSCTSDTPANKSDTGHQAAAVTDDFITFRKIGPLYAKGATGEWDVGCAIRGAWTLISGTYYWPYAADTAINGATYNWGIATMSAASAATGFPANCVFDYYDHFPGVARDVNLWGLDSGGGGSDSVGSSVITIGSGVTNSRSLLGRRQIGVGSVLQAYVKRPDANGLAHRAAELALNGRGQSGNAPLARIYDYDQTKWIKGTSGNTGTATNSNMADNIDTASYHTQQIWMISTSSVKFKNDASAWEEITTNIGTLSKHPWLFAYADAGNSCSLLVDYVKIRQYTEPEPSSTVGAETPMPTSGARSFAVIIG